MEKLERYEWVSTPSNNTVYRGTYSECLDYAKKVLGGNEILGNTWKQVEENVLVLYTAEGLPLHTFELRKI